MANEIIIRETGQPQVIKTQVTELSRGPAGPAGPAGADGADGRDGAIQYTAGTGINISSSNVISATGSSTTAWGDITGTLSNQTDLKNALDAKAGTTLTGALTDLTTTSKTNLVSAINEVDSDAATAAAAASAVDTKLTNLFTFTYKSLDDATDPLTLSCSPSAALDSAGSYLTVAKNTDGSLAKIYGRIRLNANANTCICTIGNTGLPTISSAITINGCALREAKFTDGRCMIYSASYTINTNGTITVEVGNSTTFNGGVDTYLFACLIIVKDFGDTPEP